MRLLVLTHVDGDQLLLAAVEDVGEREGGLGLSDSGRADEQEHATRLAGILQIGRGGAHALGDGLERVVLANHAPGEQRSQVADGADLVLDHPPQRYPGPRGDDSGDDGAVYLERDHRGFALQGAELSEEEVEFGLPGDRRRVGRTGGVGFELRP